MFVLFACLFACYMQMSCNLSCHISQPAHHLQMDRCWLTPTNLATWSHFRIILPQQLFAISSYLTPLQNHTIITACVYMLNNSSTTCNHMQIVLGREIRIYNELGIHFRLHSWWNVKRFQYQMQLTWIWNRNSIGATQQVRKNSFLTCHHDQELTKRFNNFMKLTLF